MGCGQCAGGSGQCRDTGTQRLAGWPTGVMPNRERHGFRTDSRHVGLARASAISAAFTACVAARRAACAFEARMGVGSYSAWCLSGRTFRTLSAQTRPSAPAEAT